jgi:hypothetical protein
MMILPMGCGHSRPIQVKERLCYSNSWNGTMIDFSVFISTAGAGRAGCE